MVSIKVLIAVAVLIVIRVPPASPGVVIRASLRLPAPACAGWRSAQMEVTRQRGR
jgi:hypothetical protein